MLRVSVTRGAETQPASELLSLKLCLIHSFWTNVILRDTQVLKSSKLSDSSDDVFPNMKELGLKLAAQATVVHLMRRQIKSFTPTCCLGSTDGSRGPFCPPQRNHFLKQPRKVRLYVSPCVQLLSALNFIKKEEEKKKNARGEIWAQRYPFQL